MKKKEIKIIYEDEHLIGLNKESGMLVIPDRYDQTKLNLWTLLNEEYEKVFPVHRIDKDTSGVVIFAKDEETHKEMNLLFENRNINKIYDAVVKGVFDKDYLEIDIPLMGSGNRKLPVIPSARGKESFTNIKLLSKFRHASHLECKILTGRQHQIRVHLSTLGFPLLVDPIYGEQKDFYLSSIKKNFNLRKNEEEKPVIERLTLHSKLISFLHPQTKKEISIEAEHSKDFKVLLNILGKYSKMN